MIRTTAFNMMTVMLYNGAFQSHPNNRCTMNLPENMCVSGGYTVTRCFICKKNPTPSDIHCFCYTSFNYLITVLFSGQKGLSASLLCTSHLCFSILHFLSAFLTGAEKRKQLQKGRILRRERDLNVPEETSQTFGRRGPYAQHISGQ